jgi:formylglycine-generating enzyme required for sulfatase activity
MADLVTRLRIFLSSPGDVPAERKIALEVIEELQYEPQFRGKVYLEPVAWDNPGAGPVLEATRSPQESIDQGLTKPADCDIVAVIFWMRMGTPLPDPPYRKANGEPYYSGAEWEYENAIEAASPNEGAGNPSGRAGPKVVVYRRKAAPLGDPDAPDFKERVEQYERVERFFAQFRDPRTRANLRGRHEYRRPADFRKQFTSHLRELVNGLLQAAPPPQAPLPSPPPELWHGSPFPGLHAFTDEDAPIFFGRRREIDDLVERINWNRFVSVVGASGSGKSSLVWAGLIPALMANSIRSKRAASNDWLWRRITPGGSRDIPDNPFMALAVELKLYLAGWEARDLAAKLAADPATLGQLMPQILAGKPEWAEFLLFIDQFEELVTVVAERYRPPFAQMLSQAVMGGRFRAVATLRADFYHQIIPVDPALVELLQNGSYPLRAPDAVSLYEMIVRPAERAGLQFEGDLARRIVDDTRNEPGRLTLMAYLLDELYQRQRRRADGRLTNRDYDELGGVAGAIGKRADQAFSQVSAEAQKALPQVFRRLVEVDDRGTATRQRALLAEIECSAPEAAEELVREFTKAGLLVADKQEAKPTVEVAHEALFQKWDLLANWIEQTHDDLRLLRQVKLAAEEWKRNARQDSYRWPDERLRPVYQMIERLEVDQAREFDATELEFIRHESDRLLEEIQNPDTPHIRRSWIGERLNMIGDPRPGVGLGPDGVPHIDWCKVELAGKSSVEVEIESVGKVKVNLPFNIARYPVTYSQFQAFIEAPDGYRNREIDWFEGLAASDGNKKLVEQRFKFPNHPRETVNWYQAIAFCRWLSWRLKRAGERQRVPFLAEEGWPEAAVVPQGRYQSASEEKASNLLNSLTGKGRRAPAKVRGFLGVSISESQSRGRTSLMDPFAWAVRLPTAAEWQLAAAGPSAKTYPWGNDWDGRFANTSESGLNRTTAVGMYPAEAAPPCGAMDISGNVWEWTLTEPASEKSDDITNSQPRVVRGGSWDFSANLARATARNRNHPDARLDNIGFRVVGVVPSP